jgi:tRNA-2-methylthio-N6-dimethylallyladenosine synthase
MTVMAEEQVVCEHLHLPVQSGSNRILQAMNRGYTRQEYLDKVARLAQAVPGLSLSTDLIVGFPGETDQDFRDTLDLVRQAGYDDAFSFKYSPRPQTRAASLPGQVPEEVKTERLARLQYLLNDLTRQAHARLVGQTAEVLVEGGSKRSPLELSGRLRTNQVVNFTGPRELVGQLVRLNICEAHPHSLKGQLVAEPPISPVAAACRQALERRLPC